MAHRVSGESGWKPTYELDRGSSAARRQSSRARLASPATAVATAVRRVGLDTALSRGANPCDSGRLTRRAAQLTSRRNRHQVAAWIDRIMCDARRPGPCFSAAVPPCGSEVAAAAPLLLEIRDRLQSSAPVYARGMAMLLNLIRDGAGPVYVPEWKGALSDELRAILRALEGGAPGA